VPDRAEDLILRIIYGYLSILQKRYSKNWQKVVVVRYDYPVEWLARLLYPLYNISLPANDWLLGKRRRKMKFFITILIAITVFSAGMIGFAIAKSDANMGSLWSIVGSIACFIAIILATPLK
jgi:hypothetical protein